MMGTVISICTCPTKGAPMIERCGEVEAIAGRGLEGDRYTVNAGTFSGKGEARRHVTLMELSALSEGNARASLKKLPWFTFLETRRNILTTSIKLNELVGKEFMVGPVLMRGVELCTPCDHPSKLAGKEDFKERFKDRGGLRAEILTSGFIKPGDPIVPEPE